MLLNRKSRRSGKSLPARNGLRPLMEAFEKRELLTAAPFLQGTVFVDTVGNGVRTTSSAEVGLPNATVTLYPQGSSTSIATTTTDSNGNYLFDGSKIPALVPGNYTLVETPPTNSANTAASAYSQIDPYTIVQPNTINVTVEPTSVTATYTSDTHPYAAIYYTLTSGGTTYTSPATVISPSIFSLANGSTTLTSSYVSYCIDAGHIFNLPPQTFATSSLTQSSIPNGGAIGYLYNHYGTQGILASAFPTSLVSNSLTDLQAGLQVAIWDLEYNNGAATGALNITGAYGATTTTEVSLIQTIANALVAEATGKSEKVAVLDTSTNGNPSDPNAPHANIHAQGILAAQSFNFGNTPVVNNSLSGVVYVDATGVGLTGPQNSPPPVNPANPTYVDTVESGVKVSLYAAGSSTPIATTTTDANGAYSFTNLPNGTYTVSETTPSGYVETYPTSASYTVPLSGGQNVPNNNFSNFMNSCNAASLTNVVYKDNGCVIAGLRGNTHQGDTVTVTFTVPSNVPSETLSLVAYSAPAATFNAATASQQSIVGLQTGTYGPGTYTETVTIPNSYYQIDFVCGAPITQFGPANSNIFYGSQGRLIDADNGGTQTYTLSTISGTVYADANGNGTFGTGDTGLGGVTVYLANASGNVVATTTTASNGTYSFANVAPGTYYVAEFAPTGYTGETPNAGTSGGAANYYSSNSLAAIGPVFVNSNTADTGNNFGNIGTSISGTVYVDATGNGLTTANVPPANSGDTPEAGVTVSLKNSSGTVVATTTTASNGTYSFNGLPTGTYSVVETVPSNQYQTGPNSLTYSVTTTATSPTSTNDNFSNYLACNMAGLTINGYIVTTPAGVSTTVSDLRGHTAQGDTVTALFTIAAGTTVPVQLSLVAYQAPTASYSSSNAYLQVIVSVATGTYGPGSYSQTVTLPNSFYQVDFACGAPLTQLELNGSKVNYQYENRLDSADNGGTQAYVLSTLSGTVYADVNGNGTFGTGDTGLGGVTVYLYNGAGTTQLATTTTASNGTYSFGGLIQGSYIVTETPPTGYTGETPNVGSNGGTASYTASSKLEKIGAIALNSNTSAVNYNFGQLKAAGSIAGTVYYDKNYDDALDCSDTGIAGVTVYLETLGGTVLSSTTSASNGTYSFTGLTPGSYQVVESAPGGYTLENGTVGSAGGKAGTGSVTSITLGSGVNATGYNLAQYKTSSSSGYYCGWSGQWQIMNDCSWGSNNLGNWLAQNCSSLCGSGSSNLWGQNNWSVANFCSQLQNQCGANSWQCTMLTAALDQYFGKC